jgi:hypothetical protein
MVHSPKYSVPDRVTITAVKPHAVEYTQTGELGLDKTIEVTKQEADMDGLQFVATDDADAEVGNPGIEQNNDYAGQADPGYQDDLADSSDYRNLASVSVPEGFAEMSEQAQRAYAASHSHLDWLNSDDDMAKTAGAHYSPNEQDELIRETGTARNLDRLSLKGTHYDPGFGVEEDEGWLW